MEDKIKPIAIISGENENIFNVISICKRALIEVGMKKEAEEMANRVYNSNSYGEEAIKIMKEYCEIK
jgi:hypothetical protein